MGEMAPLSPPYGHPFYWKLYYFFTIIQNITIEVFIFSTIQFTTLILTYLREWFCNVYI